MAVKTIKGVGTRIPQKTDIDLEALPENESDAICRIILKGVARIFENPAVMEDYKLWKAQRELQFSKEAAAL